MIGFLGFVFLVGIIFGVILDGFHHRVIELFLFKIFEEKESDCDNYGCNEKDGSDLCKSNCKHINSCLISRHIMRQLNCSQHKCNLECHLPDARSYGLIKIFLLLRKDNTNIDLTLYDYLKKSVYYYYEFYANISVSLLLFAFIAPIYMVKVFNIYFSYAFACEVVLVILSVACLDFSWMAYKRWVSLLYFSYCRCTKEKN